jgi:hypothetical protein
LLFIGLRPPACLTLTGLLFITGRAPSQRSGHNGRRGVGKPPDLFSRNKKTARRGALGRL